MFCVFTLKIFAPCKGASIYVIMTELLYDNLPINIIICNNTYTHAYNILLLFTIHFACEGSLYRRWWKTKSRVTRLMAVIYYKYINIYYYDYYNTRIHNNIVLSPKRLSRFTAPGKTSNNCSSRVVVGAYLIIIYTHTNLRRHVVFISSIVIAIIIIWSKCVRLGTTAVRRRLWILYAAADFVIEFAQQTI